MSDFGGATVLSGPGMKPRFMRRKAFIVRKSRQNLRKKVKNIDKKVKKIYNDQELEFKDVNVAANTISSTPSFTLLNGIIQGDDENRDGREINATSIQFKMNFFSNTSQLNATLIRVIIFWDAQANGAAPTAATLLDTSTIVNELVAPYNLDYQKRYKIIYDKRFVLNSNAIAGYTPASGATNSLIPVSRMIQAKRKLSRTVKFNNLNTGTVSDIVTNSLHIMWVSNQASNLPSVTAGFRFYFKDD